MKSAEEIWGQIINFLITSGPNLLLAIATLFIGLFIIRKFAKWMEQRILKRNIEHSLAYFLSSFIRFTFISLLLISVASMLGIATSSFVAVLGAVGLAVGLALQGSLSNFAGGMIILFFKPFKVGEIISSNNVEGVVEEIDILNTTLCSDNNQVIVVPNGPLANSVIINHSRKEIRRIEAVICISYNTDMENIRQAIIDGLSENPLILKTPPVEVYIRDFTEHAIHLKVFCCSKTSDFLDVSNCLQEDIMKILYKKGIALPFSRRDSHIHNHNEQVAGAHV